jgi:predicted transcriptional regulator
MSVRKRNRALRPSKDVSVSPDVKKWHIQQIRLGIAEARAGKVVPHREVKAGASRWRRQSGAM